MTIISAYATIQYDAAIAERDSKKRQEDFDRYNNYSIEQKFQFWIQCHENDMRDIIWDSYLKGNKTESRKELVELMEQEYYDDIPDEFERMRIWPE